MPRIANVQPKTSSSLTRRQLISLVTVVLVIWGIAMLFAACAVFAPPPAAPAPRTETPAAPEGEVKAAAAATQPEVKVLPPVPLVPHQLPAPPTSLPLGVYWPGEYLYTSERVEPDGKKRMVLDWERIEVALEDLAKHQVTAVWLTHRDATQTAAFARRADRHGIRVVAAIAQLDGSVPHIRKGNHDKLVPDTIKAWGAAPPPLAWGLGDEPRKDYMKEMDGYVKSWRRLAPDQPLTTVVMHGDIEVAGKVGFDALSADIYPFFSKGNPNRYMGADWAAWTANARKLRRVTRQPWMMGQAYQEPWGPYEIDKGNIVYLPGGAPHWEMPTPDQIRWMAFSAFAEGAKGMFYFLYRWPTGPRPQAKRAKLPAAAKVRTDSGAPKALVYPDGRSTPQYEAMAAAFAWIRRHAEILTPATPDDTGEIKIRAQDKQQKGHMVRLLLNPETGERHLMVVTLFGGLGPVTVPIRLPKDVSGLTQVRAGDEAEAKLVVDAAAGKASVTLPPATAALFRCTAAGQ